VLKYIEAHFANGSLTELSQMLFYDFNALSKQIKKLTGKTYTELVQEKRMSHACFLFESSNLGVSEISQLTGYENISYFHRVFRKFYGMSPKKYRDNKVTK
jgi:YesN/AraC family two-component response regulator